MNRIRIALLSGTTLAVFLTGIFVLAPTNANAMAEGTKYAAGNFRTGTSICSCPVTVGDCVCEYTPPPQPAPGPIASAE